jgi:hypothetical protein
VVFVDCAAKAGAETFLGLDLDLELPSAKNLADRLGKGGAW